ARRHHGVDTAAAHRHEREFRCHEERVQGHEQQYQRQSCYDGARGEYLFAFHQVTLSLGWSSCLLHDHTVHARCQAGAGRGVGALPAGPDRGRACATCSVPYGHLAITAWTSPSVAIPTRTASRLTAILDPHRLVRWGYMARL